MDIVQVLETPSAIAAVTGTASLLSVIAGAVIQRGIGKDVERDRFRHDIACRTADVRLTAHKDLTLVVSKAYRDKRNCSSDAQQALLDAKNFYYDNRYFFSPQLGTAFMDVAKSLALARCDTTILENNMNAFFNCVRDDLLLRDLSASVSRAIRRHKDSRKPGQP